jgi:hypothetical protein
VRFEGGVGKFGVLKLRGFGVVGGWGRDLKDNEWFILFYEGISNYEVLCLMWEKILIF